MINYIKTICMDFLIKNNTLCFLNDISIKHIKNIKTDIIFDRYIVYLNKSYYKENIIISP